jgi:hypothetical protein
MTQFLGKYGVENARRPVDCNEVFNNVPYLFSHSFRLTLNVYLQMCNSYLISVTEILEYRSLILLEHFSLETVALRIWPLILPIYLL